MKSRPFAAPLFAAPLALAAWLCASGAFGADEAKFPLGSHIGLVPPPGMTVSENFPGFEDREKRAAILISQLPGPAYEQFLKSMSSGAIEIPGVSNAKREILLTEGGAAHLVTGDQEADGVKLRKWLMITRRSVTSNTVDVTFAFVVTAQVPVDAQEAYPDAAIRKALVSTTLRASIPHAEILDRMPFTIGDFADFKGVRSIVPNRALMLTDVSGEAEPPPDSALMMISVGSGAPPHAEERGQFAQNLMRSIQGYANLRLVNAEAMRVRGQPGYEVRLEGNSIPDNTEVSIVQWLRFQGGGFIRMVGVAPKTKWNESFTRFRAVRDGIDPR
jgi:hypothetical protein